MKLVANYTDLLRRGHTVKCIYNITVSVGVNKIFSRENSVFLIFSVFPWPRLLCRDVQIVSNKFSGDLAGLPVVPTRQTPQIAVSGPIAAPLGAQILRHEYFHAGPVHPALVVLAGQQDAALDGPESNYDHRIGSEHCHGAYFNLVSLRVNENRSM